MILRLLPLLLLLACKASTPDDTDITGPVSDADGDGFTVAQGDCNDDDATVNPGATDAPYDGIDADCANDSDNDADGDGFDDAGHGGDDCDDADGTVFPGAPDTLYDGIDSDCDGESDFDGDGDGSDDIGHGGTDCDDANANIHPGATDQFYDGIDADCAGNSDYDADGDGADDIGHGGTDCDDTDGAIGPGSPEVCDAADVDEDCDGLSDDDDPSVTNTTPGPIDADGDGYAGSTGNSCDPPAQLGDCDDANAAIHPGATEVCDGADTDEDCDGLADDADASAIGQTTGPYDADGDSYAGSTGSSMLCDHPTQLGDCNDSDALINPAATEVCDGADVDEDCDGLSDDDDPSATGQTRGGFDGDGDGYSGLSGQANLCDHPALQGDCDDGEATIYPGAPEVCNGEDDDCDGTPDSPNPIDATTWYVDGDADGFGSTVVSAVDCVQPSGTSAVSTDCDDTDDTVFPNAPDVACDGLDNDCVPSSLETGGGALIGSTAYTTVRAALLAAVTGDQVDVCEGLHLVSDVVVVSGVEVVGMGGRAGTVLDAGDVGTVLRVLSDDAVIIRDLTLTGGAGFDNGSETNGGAMWIDTASDVTLQDVHAIDSRAGNGAGIFVSADSTLSLIRTDVRNNAGDSGLTPVPEGGGIYLDDRSVLNLDDSRIDANDAGSCGGVAMHLDTTLAGTSNSEVSNNTSSLAGAGICAEEGGASISGIDVTGNTTSNASAGIRGVDLTMTDVNVALNEAGLSGGGFSGSGTLLFTRVTFISNIAGIDAGAIDVAFSTSTLTLDDCVVDDNEATFFAADAGGVRINGGTLTSIGTQWGPGGIDNPPADIAYTTDGFVCNYTGGASFTYDDGSNVRICP